jgi:DNA-binding CsgD family transcriptional regulator
MLPRLKYIARPFAEASFDEVLELLDRGVGSRVARLVGVGFAARVRPPHPMFFPSSAPLAFKSELTSAVFAQGPSPIARYAQTGHPAPFTFTEAMRVLQPTGKDRWIFDLYNDYRFRDGLYCPFGPWIVVFGSDHVLKLDNETRMALAASGHMAVLRLKEMTPAPSPTGVKLSPREKVVLAHLADGWTVSEIADRMALSEPSVRTFVRRATKKLNASSQLHAVSIAIRSRLI